MIICPPPCLFPSLNGLPTPNKDEEEDIIIVDRERDIDHTLAFLFRIDWIAFAWIYHIYVHTHSFARRPEEIQKRFGSGMDDRKGASEGVHWIMAFCLIIGLTIPSLVRLN